ncbi:MAG: C25 family cysteine peptidase [Candidatus Thermoplasmatota archaeon]
MKNNPLKTIVLTGFIILLIFFNIQLPIVITSNTTAVIALSGKKQITPPGKVSYPDDLSSHNNSADYLIITSDYFYNPARKDFLSGTQNNKLNELAHWRAIYNGFDVAVVNVNNSFIGGNIDTKIKQFIKYVYNNWSAPHQPDNHCEYILLVGDTPFITSHFTINYLNKQCVSDRWFVCLDGESDILPEIMIGRFSVDDQTELDVIAEKTILYEKYPEPGDWQHNVLMAQGTWAPFFNYSFIKEVLLENSGWNVTEVFYPQINNETIVNAINRGVKMIYYCGHGDYTTWEINFGLYTFEYLENGYKLPVVITSSCYTGSFQLDNKDCLGEVFLNSPGKGAVAYYGASTEGGNSKFSYYALKSVFENFTYSIGNIIDYLIYHTYEDNGGNIEYNLLGDPALDLSGSVGFPERPDLTISHLDISLDPENLTTEDKQANITATISNIGGNEAENIVVRFLAVDRYHGRRFIIGENIIPQILPKTHYTLRQIWNISEEMGKRSVLIQIDPENTISEAYKLNNQAGINIMIYPITTYVDDDFNESTPGWSLDHFAKIQEGINMVGINGTVIVNPGIYQENLEILKPLTLRGVSKSTTSIIAMEKNKCIIRITADNVNVTGFTITKGQYCGIELYDVCNVTIVDCVLTQNNFGILFGKNTRCAIFDCLLTQNNYSIYLTGATWNTITKNRITNNHKAGINITTGSNNNTIIQNVIINNAKRGISIDKPFFGSKESKNNRIYHNTFINNNPDVYDRYRNFWDNGYTGGGNYWYDWAYYTDDFQGPEQNNPGADGIIDQGLPSGGLKPYPIQGPGGNQDKYPLKHPFILGDMNLDGKVDFNDIDPFVLALAVPGRYQERYSMLPVLHGDINQDGRLDFGDINPFIQVLISLQIY